MRQMMFLSACVGLGVAALAAAVCGQERRPTDQERDRSNKDSPSGVQGAQSTTGKMERNGEFRVERASRLLGTPVTNERGTRLGVVHELIMDPDNESRVPYVVVSLQGPDIKGERYTAIPIGALNWRGINDGFRVNMTTEQLRNLQTFERDRWPNMTDRAWGTYVHELFGTQPYWNSPAGGSAGDVRLRAERSRDIVGRTVTDRANQNIGKIEDMMIDPDTGRVAYNVVSVNQPGGSTQYYPIPATILEYSGRNTTWDIQRDRLRGAPSFEQNRWPNWADPQYSTDVYNYYNQNPYWLNNNQNPGDAQQRGMQSGQSPPLGQQGQPNQPNNPNQGGQAPPPGQQGQPNQPNNPNQGGNNPPGTVPPSGQPQPKKP